MNARGDRTAPLYARLLHLKHIHPGGLMCFLLFEGVIAFAILLSLAELVNWWSVLVVPAIVAGLVKINDIVAGAFSRSSVVDATMRFTTRRQLGAARGRASVVPRGRREPDLESPTQALPHESLGPDGVVRAFGPVERSLPSAAEPPTRAARRRATNQRRFAPSATETHKKER